MNKHPNIERVELRTVAKTLTYEQMMSAKAEAELDIENIMNSSQTPK